MPSSPGGTIIPVEYDLAKIEAVISENTNIFMTKLYKSKYSLDIIIDDSLDNIVPTTD